MKDIANFRPHESPIHVGYGCSRDEGIRDLRRIRNTLDFTTAKTIATSLIHSKVD